jgi:hypothetical protein
LGSDNISATSWPDAGLGDGTFIRPLHFGQAKLFPAASSGALSLAPQEQATEMDIAVSEKKRSDVPESLRKGLDHAKQSARALGESLLWPFRIMAELSARQGS